MQSSINGMTYILACATTIHVLTLHDDYFHVLGFSIASRLKQAIPLHVFSYSSSIQSLDASPIYCCIYQLLCQLSVKTANK